MLCLYLGRGERLFKNAVFHVILTKARLIQIHKPLNSYKFLLSEMDQRMEYKICHKKIIRDAKNLI